MEDLIPTVSPPHTLLTDILSAYWHCCRLSIPRGQWQPLLPMSLLILAPRDASSWLVPITAPSNRRFHLTLMEREHFIQPTLICQLTGAFWCRNERAGKIRCYSWRMKRDSWVRHKLQSNIIMCFRYKYKMTRLTVHTRFYFISLSVPRHHTLSPYSLFIWLHTSHYDRPLTLTALHIKKWKLAYLINLYTVNAFLLTCCICRSGKDLLCTSILMADMIKGMCGTQSLPKK